MTPEQLRQRRRDRHIQIMRKDREIETSEMQSMAEEADAIDKHYRITGVIRGLRAQYEGTKEFCSFFGGHKFLFEILVKMQQAELDLKNHEYRMGCRGFKIPTQDC